MLPPVIVLFFYAWRLPPFRTSQILGGLAVLLPMFVYLVRATFRAHLPCHSLTALSSHIHHIDICQPPAPPTSLPSPVPH